MRPPPDPAFLEGLYSRHHRLQNLHPDPLVFARGHGDPADGEVAGLVAASLAYGQVGQIMETLGGVFERLGTRPASFVVRSTAADLKDSFKDFSYRFHKSQDLALFLWLLRQALEQHGRLLHLFLKAGRGSEIGPSLVAFSDAILSGDARPILRVRAVPPGHPVRHLLSSPARGGAAKRLCLYLRWMVRKDVLDPGYWNGSVDPSGLVVPLDTHVARVALALNLTGRRTADWKTARDITATLRRYDPEDPVRFDFSLFRYGMRGG